MADVFISYSHADIDFVRRLAFALQDSGKDIFVDQGNLWRNRTGQSGPSVQQAEDPRSDRTVADSDRSPPSASESPNSEPDTGRLSGLVANSATEAVPEDDKQPLVEERQQAEMQGILPSARWMEVIEAAIAEADAVIAVISPDFAASSVCTTEIDHAEKLHKRIVPIVVRATPPEDLPAAVRDFNFQFFEGPETFDTDLVELLDHLATDIDRIHFHTSLLLRALEWDGSDRDRALLLRGRPLKEAEEWLENQGERKPTPTPEQTSLITASRRATIRRQQGSIAVSLSVAFALALVAVLAIVEWRTAIDQRNTSTSRQLAAESSNEIATDPQVALILALRANSIVSTAQSQAAIRAADFASTVRARLPASGDEGDPNSTYENGLSAFDPSGQWAVVWKGDAIRVWAWERRTGAGSDVEPIALNAGSPVSDAEIMIAHDDFDVLFTTTSGDVKLWQLPDPPSMLNEESSHHVFLLKSGLKGAVLNPNGRQVASITSGGQLALQDLFDQSSRVIDTTVTGGTIGSADLWFSPDGTLVAAPEENGDTTSISVWSTSTGAQTFPALILTNDEVQTAAIAPGDDRIAVGGAFSSGIGVEVYQLADPTAPSDEYSIESPPGLPAHCCDVDEPTALAWNPTGTVLAAGTEDPWIRIWVGASTTPVYLVATSGGGAAGLDFSPGGQYLLTSGGPCQLWEWAAATTLTVSDGPVADAAGSPNGQWFALALEDGRIELWNWKENVLSELTQLTVPSGGVTREKLAFSPNSRYLALAGPDQAIRIWSVSSMSLVAGLSVPDLNANGGAVFDPSGLHLAFVETSGVGIWNWSRHPNDGVVSQFHAAPAGSSSVLLNFAESNTLRYLSLASNGTVDLTTWTQAATAAISSVTVPSIHVYTLNNAALLSGGTQLLISDESGTYTWTIGSRQPTRFLFDPRIYDTQAFAEAPGQFVAFSGLSGQILSWGEQAGTTPVPVTTVSYAAPTISVLPDGSRLIIFSQDANEPASLYPCTTCGSFARVLASAERDVVRQLTPTEQRLYVPND